MPSTPAPPSFGNSGAGFRSFQNRSPDLVPLDRLFAQSKYYVNAYQQTQEFGRCVSHLGPRLAERVLASDPNTVHERVEFRQLSGVGRACISYGYRAPTVFVRGSIAEAMYHDAVAANGNSIPLATTARLIAFAAAEEARSAARLADDRLFTSFSNCVVVRAPIAVGSLLDSRHGTPGERAALTNALKQASGCTSSTTLPAAAATSFLRAYLAESAYRWATLKA
jgi:hypothetical protein